MSATTDATAANRARAGLLVELGSATLGECGGRPLHSRIRPAWRGARLAAPVFTAQCEPGDNLAVHVAVARAPAGSALAVDASALPERGYWGEVLTTAAQSRGLAGLVIDGGVRDVAALEAHGFPVFSAGLALPGATKNRGGCIGGPIEIGGVALRSGDWIVGDADGATAVAAERLEEVLAAARARAARERELFTRLRAGATTLELLGLDPARVREAGGEGDA